MLAETMLKLSGMKLHVVMQPRLKFETDQKLCHFFAPTDIYTATKGLTYKKLTLFYTVLYFVMDVMER